MRVKILMVDDHPALLEGNKALLQLGKENYELDVSVAYNCKEAFTAITEASAHEIIDVLFLDYSLPPFPEEKIFNGLDLGVLARKHLPNVKIFMITSHDDGIRLYNIVKKIQSNALLVKSEYKPQDLPSAFQKVIDRKSVV